MWYSIYSETDIYVRSTDVDRTLMSAMSNLAGLYPPKGNQIWNPSILWQPIPVHTKPKSEDNLLSTHAECPKFNYLFDEMMKSEEMKGTFIVYFQSMAKIIYDNTLLNTRIIFLFSNSN